MMNFQTSYIGKRLLYFSYIASTNWYLKEVYDGHLQEGLVVVSDYQSEGYGQRKARWQAKRGTSLLFSILLHAKPTPNSFTQITQIGALSIVKVLETHCGLEAKIKWPNDIYIRQGKCCGLLSEHRAERHSEHIILGIGLNVNQSCSDFDPELRNTTSLAIESSRSWDKQLLLHSILLTFEEHYEKWKLMPFETFIPDITYRLRNKNTRITIKQTSQELEGELVGITREGHLLIRTEEQLHSCYTGRIC